MQAKAVRKLALTAVLSASANVGRRMLAQARLRQKRKAARANRRTVRPRVNAVAAPSKRLRFRPLCTARHREANRAPMRAPLSRAVRIGA
jgi:hypothetical protein